MTDIQFGLKEIPLKDLLLDPFNPRLPEGRQGQDQTNLAIDLELGFEALSIAESISMHGFFKSEPLIAIPSDESGKYIVVEGNRRLTALFGLTDPNLRSQFLESGKWQELASNIDNNSLTTVPVDVRPDRIDVIPVIGYRHITGIQPWQPFAQAKFVANHIDKNGMTAAEIAKSIGLTKTQVFDLYRDQAIVMQAREFGIQTGNLEGAFSLLTVAMKNTKLREHVGAPVGSQLVPGNKPIPVEKEAELREVLKWIFGEGETEPVISDSRQIGQLATVVASPNGLTALREGKSLAEAKQLIETVGLDPKERLLKRMGAANAALNALMEDIAGFESDQEVIVLYDKISEGYESLRSAMEI